MRRAGNRRRSRGRSFDVHALHLLFASAVLFATGCDDAPVIASAPPETHDPESTNTVTESTNTVTESTNTDTDTDTDTDTETDHPITPVPRTVRVVPLSERDLLGSETRAFTTLERTLDRAGFDATVATPDRDERAAASAWLDGGSPRARAWAGVETVVLFELATPELDRRGRSIPRGSTRIVVFRANDRAPRFRLIAAPEAGFVLDGRVGAWLLDLVRGLDEGGPP